MTEQLDKNGLVSCPFCGHTKIIGGGERADPYQDYSSSECEKCGAQGPMVDISETDSPEAADELCNAAFNTRAQGTGQQQERVEAWERCYARICDAANASNCPSNVYSLLTEATQALADLKSKPSPQEEP